MFYFGECGWSLGFKVYVSVVFVKIVVGSGGVSFGYILVGSIFV